MDSSNSSNPCREDVNEFQKYLADQNFTKDENALRFWQAKQTAYSNLSKLAKKILAVPATLARIERVFSHAGNILRPDRSRLKPKHFEEMLFLKLNSDLAN